MRRRTEEDLADELEVHLELQARKYVARGMSEGEARRLARLEFGSMEKTREECRETDRWAVLDAFGRNLKYAMRSLGRQPGFALIAVAILTMGIGSTLAVFNLLDALMLRPLPIRNAAELVRISRMLRKGEFGTLPTTFLDALRTVPDFSGVCGFDTGYPAVEIHGSITSVGTLGFSGDCFSTLGIQIQLGRSLTPQDDRPGAEAAAVITDALWRRQFNRSRDVLGQRIRMEGQTYTVVGVAEPRFTGLLIGFPEGLMIPASQEYSEPMPNGKKPTYWWVNILARRAQGISEQQASARLKVRAQELLETSVPPHYNAERRKNYLKSKITISSGRAGIDYFLRRRFGDSLYASGGICAAILLIGCTNLINLLLARSLRRRHETAVRFALGAKLSQIVGLFATESFLLVAVGAGLGLLLAQMLDKWLVALGAHMFGNFDLGLFFDWRTALLLAAATTAITIAFAGVSAWQAGQIRSSRTLKESGRGIAGSTGAAQKILIGLQISLTLALVAGSSLLTASLDHLYTIDLGVKARNVWDVTLSTRPGAKTYFVRGPYDREILNEIHQIPGVETATLTDSIPFYALPDPEPIAAVDNGRPQHDVDGTVLATSAEFFKTLGMKIIAGQEFEEREGGEPAVAVSESLAAQLAVQPQDLIGHHIRLGTDSRCQRLRVSGVVSNAQLNLAHPEQLAPFTAYINIWQHPDRQGYPVLLIKTASSSLNLEALRKIVDSRGHEYVYRVRTLVDEKDGALMENKLLAYLSEAFSGLALAMAATGLFGLLSYQVANRTSEIGLRMALGAQRAQIQWMIVRQIIAVVTIGSAVGLFCSLGVARMIQGLLFGVSPYNPRLLALSCAVLGATALLAAWLPARRASSVDPLTALRHE
ncbi:MAG: ABC transporter permease [Acidobacteriota bacterium]|nr:ABC transporter permease [Acidobacteriota bacterium]